MAFASQGGCRAHALLVAIGQGRQLPGCALSSLLAPGVQLAPFGARTPDVAVPCTLMSQAMGCRCWRWYVAVEPRAKTYRADACLYRLVEPRART